jgi:uncharacterized membrane protein
MNEEHPDLARLVGADTRSPLGWLPVVLGIVIVAAMALTWPDGDLTYDLSDLGVTSEVYRAEVTDVLTGPCSYSPDSTCSTAFFRLLEGPTPDTTAFQEFESIPSAPSFRVGEVVVLNYLPDSEPVFQYQFADRDRRPLLLAVTAVFALAVVVLGRMRGLAALGGLAASVGVLLVYIVPGILEGASPVVIATIGALAIGFLALYLAHGIRPLTHVALIGTFGALVITVILSAIVVRAARFSGFAGEESLYLTLVGDIDVRGLLLAGIVLGALGALDDVTVTQASAVWELRRANPELTHSQLFQAGLRVGRDHIASTVNTLLLAYAGAAMPLLLLFALSRQSLSVIANSEVVAVEIVRTLVGSIGLVSAVPLTTWLAARVVHQLDPREIGHGH